MSSSNNQAEREGAASNLGDEPPPTSLNNSINRTTNSIGFCHVCDRQVDITDSFTCSLCNGGFIELFEMDQQQQQQQQQRNSNQRVLIDTLRFNQTNFANILPMLLPQLLQQATNATTTEASSHRTPRSERRARLSDTQSPEESPPSTTTPPTAAAAASTTTTTTHLPSVRFGPGGPAAHHLQHIQHHLNQHLGHHHHHQHAGSNTNNNNANPSETTTSFRQGPTRLQFIVPGDGEQVDLYGIINNVLADVLGGGGGGGGNPGGQPGIQQFHFQTPPIRMFQLHGDARDYAWGPTGLDTIITQLLNQLENTGPPPATDDQLNSLPIVTIGQEEIEKNVECAICMDDFRLNDKAKRLPCKHYFHEPCIIEWLKMHGTCPVCRKTLNGEDTSQREYVSSPQVEPSSTNNNSSLSSQTNASRNQQSNNSNSSNNNNNSNNSNVYYEPDFD